MSLYQVETITAKRYNTKTQRFQYKVKWKNYPESQSTWEPKIHLHLVQDLIQKYESKLKDSLKDQRKNPSKIKAIELSQSQHVTPLNSRSLVQSEPLSLNKTKNIEKNRLEFKKRGRPRKYPLQKLKEKLSQNENQSELSKSQNIIEDFNDYPSNNEKLIANSLSNQPKRKRGRPKKIRLQISMQGKTKDKSEQKMDNTINLQQLLYLEGDGEQKDYSLDIPQILDKLPDQYSDENFQSQKNFTILELSRKGQNLIFLVEDNYMRRWMSKAEIVRDHPIALIDFYEKHMTFFKDGQEQASEQANSQERSD